MIKDLRRSIRPAVNYCLERALGIRELLEAARFSFVEVATEEMKSRGEPPNISRLSVVTGLQRPVVKEILDNRKEQPPTRFSIRVISKWRTDKKFRDKSGRPAVLPFDGRTISFCSLVKSVSKDIAPGTVLFDLQRLNFVEQSDGGLKLTAKIPGKTKGLEHVKNLTQELEISEAERENQLVQFGQLPNYVGRIVLDNIAEEDLDIIRSGLTERCSKFQKEIESYLSSFDLDLVPDSNKSGGRQVTFGIYTKMPSISGS